MKTDIYQLAEDAIVVSFGEDISPDIYGHVTQLCQTIKKEPFLGFLEAVPAYTTVTLFYDVLTVCLWEVDLHQYLVDLLDNFCQNSSEIRSGKLVEVPVCYDGDFAPDLLTLAAAKKMTSEDIVRQHTGREYLVYMMGFLPGFAYMGPVDESIVASRKDIPRHRVEAGSVGIAGRQTGIYPLDSPGGWQIIGRTPLQVFDPFSDTPFLFAAGDKVRFYPISADAFLSQVEVVRHWHKEKQPSGTCIADVTKPGFSSIFVDEGRAGFRACGVPVSGPSDSDSYYYANAVLDNPRNSTTIEVTMGNFAARFEQDAVISLGGHGAASVEGRVVSFYTPTPIKSGQSLELMYTGGGIKSYIAVQGGFLAEKLMGSSCAIPSVEMGDFLVKGQKLFAGARKEFNQKPGIQLPESIALNSIPILRFFAGRHFDRLTPNARQLLESSDFVIGNRSNKMGIHLDNIILSRTSDHELLSTAVTMGLVQLTHEGRLIILMQDCQTTGGYPGVIQIIKSDLPVLAQLKPGSVIRLKMITFDLAKSIEIDRQNKIRDLYGSEL